jgi:hypothetical protein
LTQLERRPQEKNGRRPKKWEKNGRQPQQNENGRRPQQKMKMEDNLHFLWKTRMTTSTKKEEDLKQKWKTTSKR